MDANEVNVDMRQTTALPSKVSLRRWRPRFVSESLPELTVACANESGTTQRVRFPKEAMLWAQEPVRKY